MGFEYQTEPGRGTRVTYNDENIDRIYKAKASLKIDVQTEIEKLKELKQQTEEEYEKARDIRDSITDWDSDEAYQAEDACSDLWSKIDTLEDLIDSLEDLNNVL